MVVVVYVFASVAAVMVVGAMMVILTLGKNEEAQRKARQDNLSSRPDT